MLKFNLQGNIKEILRYGVVGGFGAILHILIIILLVELLIINPVLSSVIGFFVVLLISFIMNKFWTFKDRKSSKFQFFKYMTVSLIGLALNTGIMYVTVNIFEWSYTIGMGIMVIVVALNNYILNRFWTFN